MVAGTKSDHPYHPDYVPTIFKHVSTPKKRETLNAVANFDRRQNLKRKRLQAGKLDDAVVATGLLHPSQTDNHEEFGEQADAVSTPNDLTHCNSDQCKRYIQILENECQQLRTENMELKQKLHNLKFDEKGFENDDDKVRTLTGFPSFQKLKLIYGHVHPWLMSNASIPPFQQFIFTMLRLRLNVTLTFLCYLFHISNSAGSRIFHNCTNILYKRMVPLLVKWPGRDELRLTLPFSFRNRFSRCTCIIDCFEIFTEKPQLYLARSQTYSSYKSHNTMKYMIAITPQGTISFISKGWGGRTSDKHIVENSGFLNNLLPGDLVLADRGFEVADSVALFNAELRIPAFTRGKKQLDPIDIEKTRGLASVRIHVERVIGLTRQKFTILDGPIPLTLLDSSNGEMPLDKIVHICCAITNLSESVVPFE